MGFFVSRKLYKNIIKNQLGLLTSLASLSFRLRLSAHHHHVMLGYYMECLAQQHTHTLKIFEGD